MAYSYHSSGVSHYNFKSFDTAEAHFKSVKPIRGSDPEIRPIGSNRRYKWCAIAMPDTDTVQAILYDTPCVEYRRDGTVTLRLDKWVTYSTANFMDAVLPPQFGVVSLNKRRVVLTTPNGDKYEIPRGPDGLTFNANDWTKLTLADNEDRYEYVADRKMIKQVREYFRPFIDYVKVCGSMNNKYTSDDMIDLFPEVIETTQKFWDEEVAECKKWNNDHQGYSRYPSIARIMYSAHGHHFYSKAPLIRRDTQWEHWYRRNRKEAIENMLNCLAMASSGDGEQFQKLMFVLAANADVGSGYSHNQSKYVNNIEYRGYDYHGKMGVRSWTVEAKTLIDNFEDMFKTVYADLCYKKQLLKGGKLPNDNSKKYVMGFEAIKDNLTSRQNVL
jgi:hypothetical protein